MSHGAVFEIRAWFKRLMSTESLRSVLRLVKSRDVVCVCIDARSLAVTPS